MKNFIFYLIYFCNVFIYAFLIAIIGAYLSVDLPINELLFKLLKYFSISFPFSIIIVIIQKRALKFLDKDKSN